jgi:hypothetical protein
MKKILLILIFALFLLPNISNAQIKPVNKECLQRGYDAEEGYCIFPNGTKCNIQEFNNGKCGSEFMTTDYCVEEGNFVWEKDKCCKGLKPELHRAVGSDTCQPSNIGKAIWIYSLLILLLIIINYALKYVLVKYFSKATIIIKTLSALAIIEIFALGFLELNNRIKGIWKNIPYFLAEIGGILFVSMVLSLVPALFFSKEHRKKAYPIYVLLIFIIFITYTYLNLRFARV